MSDVHFSGSANAADRRRRRLLTEIDPEFDLSDATINSNQYECAADIAPFPMLSRDRLIRRVISPRLWKHVAVAVVLTLTPIVYAFVTWPSSSSSNIPDHALLASRLEALRGLSGLKLFAAAEFCLVIAWVRSASAVDFRGRYRWWRWMAVGLFAASLTLLTGVSPWITDLTAQGLEPLFGRIDAARPALILVPSGACLAFVLRRLIPDMGRCRPAQSLLVISTLLLAVRAFAGARQHSATVMFHLSTLELLISGLMLSAFQLHARFVIHVNPNPPLAVQRKSTADRVKNVNHGAIEATVVEIVGVQPATVVIAGSSDAASIPIEIEEEHRVDHDSVARTAPEVEAASASQVQHHGKSKNGKKQKYRKAG